MFTNRNNYEKKQDTYREKIQSLVEKIQQTPSKNKKSEYHILL